MAPYATPRSYVAKISRYRPGDPRRDVAEKRAAFAIGAARAAQRGDRATAARALAGLHALRGFGDIDADAMAAIIRRTGAGDVTPERARSIANTISTISSIAGSIVQIIAAAVGGDVGRVLRWVDAIIRANAPPEALSNQDFQNFCRVWQGMSSGGFVAAATASVNAVASIGHWPTEQRNNVNLFIRWVAAALDSICAEVGPVPAAGATAAPCVGVGVSPANHGLPAEASSCCPGLSFNAARGLCQNPPADPMSPEVQARYRWQRALVARRTVEVTLVNPAASSAAKAAAAANDTATATELCAAETAMLEYQNPLPAWGAPASAEAATTAGLAMSTPNPLGAIAIAALYSYMPPSTTPRCFIRTRPVGGCSCGSQGGGGGIFTIALPVAAALWYFMK